MRLVEQGHRDRERLVLGRAVHHRGADPPQLRDGRAAVGRARLAQPGLPRRAGRAGGGLVNQADQLVGAGRGPLGEDLLAVVERLAEPVGQHRVVQCLGQGGIAQRRVDAGPPEHQLEHVLGPRHGHPVVLSGRRAQRRRHGHAELGEGLLDSCATLVSPAHSPPHGIGSRPGENPRSNQNYQPRRPVARHRAGRGPVRSPVSQRSGRVTTAVPVESDHRDHTGRDRATTAPPASPRTACWPRSARGSPACAR